MGSEGISVISVRINLWIRGGRARVRLTGRKWEFGEGLREIGLNNHKHATV